MNLKQTNAAPNIAPQQIMHALQPVEQESSDPDPGDEHVSPSDCHDNIVRSEN